MSDADSPPTGPVLVGSHRSGPAAWVGKPVHHRLRVRWSTVLLTVGFLGLGALYLLVPHAKRVTYYVRAVPDTTVPAAPSTSVAGRRVPTGTPAASTTTTTPAGATSTTTASESSTTTTSIAGSSSTTTSIAGSTTTTTTTSIAGSSTTTSTAASSTTTTRAAGATSAHQPTGG